VTFSAIWAWFLPVSVWLLAIGWLWQLVLWVRNSPRLADLTQLPTEQPEQFAPRPTDPASIPDLTVIVPACNEEACIGATLRSLLASRGIRLQIIAVDDRSTDRTGSIMDSIMTSTMEAVGMEASQQVTGHTLQVLHVRELPHGWLGKPHAVAIAAEAAQADWILFTDGDVLFAPEALTMALRYALSEHADHLVLMPHWIISSFGEAAMHGAIHALTTWTFRPWRVADPNARDFIGVGAFNLVRRSTYQAIGGFAALRMEVIEDLRFGWMVKRAGYRQRFALGSGLASVRWSHGAWGVVRNLEKNLFALHRYRVGPTLLTCLGLAVQIVFPIVALWIGGWSRTAAIVLYACVTGIYIASRNFTRVSVAYVLVYPLAVSLFLFAMLRSMTLALLRGGVVWRGTLYPLKDLRDHAGETWSRPR
jgi:cellulose synthase/poly-beta-1,6-N-acetylglucosamine synthase-like glycosyltransferase